MYIRISKNTKDKNDCQKIISIRQSDTMGKPFTVFFTKPYIKTDDQKYAIKTIGMDHRL
jgi:hypothetical protein